jgi:hypothetical protein
MSLWKCFNFLQPECGGRAQPQCIVVSFQMIFDLLDIGALVLFGSCFFGSRASDTKVAFTNTFRAKTVS